MSELKQNLPKLGPQHSSLHEKQMHIVDLVKKGELKLELWCDINMNIPGLRKRAAPGAQLITSKRWWRPFHSFERNGVLNWGIQRNWVRFSWPFLPLFWCFYTMHPLLHGVVYKQQYNNYQWEGGYLKTTLARPPPMEQSLVRIA